MISTWNIRFGAYFIEVRPKRHRIPFQSLTIPATDGRSLWSVHRPVYSECPRVITKYIDTANTIIYVMKSKNKTACKKSQIEQRMIWLAKNDRGWFDSPVYLSCPYGWAALDDGDGDTESCASQFHVGGNGDAGSAFSSTRRSASFNGTP